MTVGSAHEVYQAGRRSLLGTFSVLAVHVDTHCSPGSVHMELAGHLARPSNSNGCCWSHNKFITRLDRTCRQVNTWPNWPECHSCKSAWTHDMLTCITRRNRSRHALNWSMDHAHMHNLASILTRELIKGKGDEKNMKSLISLWIAHLDLHTRDYLCMIIYFAPKRGSGSGSRCSLLWTWTCHVRAGRLLAGDIIKKTCKNIWT